MKRFEKNTEFAEKLNRYGVIKSLRAGKSFSPKTVSSVPLLMKGLLKVYSTDNQGRQQLLYYLKPEELCVMSVFSGMLGQNCNLTATAIQDSEILLIPVKKAMEWIQEYPEWSKYIFEMYYNRFNDMANKMQSLTHDNLEMRLMHSLKTHQEVSGGILLIIKHEDLADELNTNRVVVSRLLKKLEKEGKVALGRNKIEILF